jgi:Raf kinase inhibitor-like YbhB/YbcL family protein
VSRQFALALGAILILSACSASTDTTSPDSASSPTTTTAQETTGLGLSSPAFAEGEVIPTEYSCDGSDTSPQLDIAGIAPGTVSLVLIMDDPDAPGGTWDHWLAFNIEPTETIARGEETIGTSGRNSWDEIGYGGPCPPSGSHRYFFRVFALDSILYLDEGADKATVTAAMKGHTLEIAELIGVYSRG